MNKTIRITGEASIEVKPDTIVVSMDAEKTEETYDAAIERFNHDTNTLAASLIDAGFDGGGIKTSDFAVNAAYENYRDEHNEWKQKFAGYRYRHSMRYELPVDNKKLGAFIYAVADSGVCPKLNFAFTVKNPAEARDKLLEAAVVNAKARAVALCKAAGVAIKDLVQIDYSDNRVLPVPRSFEVAPMALQCRAASDNSVNVRAEDVKLTDSVSVVWEIG